MHKVPVLSVSHSDVISERPAAGQPTAAEGQTKNDLHDVRRENTVAKSTASSLISTTGKTNIVTAGLVIFDKPPPSLQINSVYTLALNECPKI